MDLIIKFSMDRIKNMDQLYTWTSTYSDVLEDFVKAEQYHGTDYCKQVITDVLSAINWEPQEYLGELGQIANEVFKANSPEGAVYRIEFAINTYEKKVARLECTITGHETENYDQKLEELKIALKNRLIQDWDVCTWLVDMQSAHLCKEAYEKAFIIENNLRAFAGKILIHFLGIDWIKSAGLENEAESVKNLKGKFVKRVPEFVRINTDFLSMTLETLVKIIFKGTVYKDDDVVLSRSDCEKIWKKAGSGISEQGIFDCIKSKRVVEKNIWEDLFVPFIDEPEKFKEAAHNFIEDRNHVAHSKVLSWSAYQVILKDFEKMDEQIRNADAKFDMEETSDELLDTWSAEEEQQRNEREYYRDRLASETGIDVLDGSDIENQFDETLQDLYDAVFQRYHLDVCYEISDFQIPNEGTCFTVTSPVLEDGSLRVDVFANYIIDDDLGVDSVCKIECRDGEGKTICSAEISFRNGNGHEGEEGLMEADEDSEYDTSELEELREELFEYIDEKLNPYPGKLDAHVYENKGDNAWTADFACSQCGKFGVSIHEEFLPIGRCCYCGWDNELEKCDRCGQLVDVDVLENGLCPSCSAYVDKQ